MTVSLSFGRLAAGCLARLCLASLLAGVASSGHAEKARAVIEPLGPAGASAEAFPKPDRPVAEIVSPIWATEAQRDEVDEVGQVARLLGIGPGMNVADLGAGSGYYTVRLARVVGPSGKIIAEDVMPRYMAGLRRRAAKLGLANVVLALGEASDPRLPAGFVDVAILIHMYHEIAQPFAFLHNLAPAMRPGSRIGIVDLDRPTHEHGTPPALLRCEVEALGYRQIGFHQLAGGVGYLAIFTPPKLEERPAPGDIEPCSAPG